MAEIELPGVGAWGYETRKSGILKPWANATRDDAAECAIRTENVVRVRIIRESDLRVLVEELERLRREGRNRGGDE